MRLSVALLLLNLMATAAASSAAAEDKYDVARRVYPELFKIYYDAGILEYCGLINQESAGGFRLSRDAVLARDAMDEDQHRNVRISAYTAVDVEYANRGLGGYKGWCRTEGRDAYDRFVAYFGAHHVAQP
jgi:hypothetical protein